MVADDLVGSGLETLLIGMSAAGVAFAVGYCLKAVISA
jgi:hypothetical protein